MVNVPNLLLTKVVSTSPSKMGKLHNSTTDVSTYPIEGKVLKMIMKVDGVAEGGVGRDAGRDGDRSGGGPSTEKQNILAKPLTAMSVFST